MQGFSLNLPERRRNYRFALTPLADAMFQLLIFFMLSSGLTPYSLLTLQSAAPQSDSAASAPGDTGDIRPVPPQTDPRVALWTVEANAVLVGGQRFDFDALGELAAALGTADDPAQVILLVRPSAQVQDVTTVLSRLAASDVTSVKVSMAGAF